MQRASVAPSSRVTDLVYAGIALVAAVLTVVLAVVGGRFNPLVVVAMLITLVPWALLVFGVDLPQLAFAALAIIPVIPVMALSEFGAALFVSFAAASRIASRSDDRWLVGTVTVVILALPFVPFLFGVEWDVGAIYFAFGGAFSVLVGLLLRRATRLADELRAAEGALGSADGRGRGLRAQGQPGRGSDRGRACRRRRGSLARPTGASTGVGSGEGSCAGVSDSDETRRPAVRRCPV